MVELGLRCLEVIKSRGGHITAMVTLHDHLAQKKSGRVFLDELSRSCGWPLHKIRHINDPETVALLAALDLDWLFIIGWSQIASAESLATVRRGCIGMHPTLLPVGRGRAAVPWAILRGLPETGVTAFQLAPGVDTGPILGQERIPMEPRETATTLYAKVGRAHEALMASLWDALVEDRVVGVPQDESNATYWPGRTPDDGRILPTMSVEEVDRLVRATTRPYPGAFVPLTSGVQRIWAGRPALESDLHGDGSKELVIECADGAFIATEFATESA